MIVYKVVKEIDKKLYSAITIYSCAIEYKKNKWVKPDFGKIYCFDNLPDANFFKESITHKSFNYKIRVFKAKTDKIYTNIKFTTGAYSTRKKAFWRGEIGMHNLIKVPNGTVFCNKIKLLEEV